MKKITLIPSILILSSCTSNQYIPDFSNAISNISVVLAPEVYKNDINQGSVLRIKNFQKIKIGMTQNEVINLIGTPSIDDIFHRNQWEYIHHSTLKNDEILSLRITLFFDNGKLVNITKYDDAKLKLIEEKNINLDSLDISDKKLQNSSDWYKFW
jgi:outer membrane protein assembly factor BamE